MRVCFSNLNWQLGHGDVMLAVKPHACPHVHQHAPCMCVHLGMESSANINHTDLLPSLSSIHYALRQRGMRVCCHTTSHWWRACLFVSYFELRHQCGTCQRGRVNKPLDFRALAFLRKRFVPVLGEGMPRHVVLWDFWYTLHQTVQTANGIWKMKSVCAKTSSGWRSWVCCVLQRLRAVRGWGASVLDGVVPPCVADRLNLEKEWIKKLWVITVRTWKLWMI